MSHNYYGYNSWETRNISKEKETMANVKAAFEKKITKNAGRTGLKASISEKLADMGYNFTRFLYERKDMPNAAAIRKQMSQGR